MNLRQSTRSQTKMRLALQGCSGSGKTYGALQLAYGLRANWSKIAVIDTENGSADLYAHLGAYNVLPLSEPYTPEKYIEAMGEITISQYRKRVDNTRFEDSFEKLIRGEKISDSEIGRLLRVAIAFINYGDIHLIKLGYNIIIEYSTRAC